MKYAVVDVKTWNELKKSGYATELPAAPTVNYIVGEVTEVPALNNHILAVLDGGSIVDGEPVLEGKALDGWYTSADFTGAASCHHLLQ